jgi:hypothetical protein
LNYEVVDMDFPVFPPPVSSFFMFTKEVMVFGNNVSGIKNCKGFSSFKEDP